VCFEPGDDIGVEAQHVRGPDGQGLAVPGCGQEWRAEAFRIDGKDRGWQLHGYAINILIIGHSLDESAVVVIESAEGIDNAEVVGVEGYLPGRESLVQPVVAGLAGLGHDQAVLIDRIRGQDGLAPRKGGDGYAVSLWNR